MDNTSPPYAPRQIMISFAYLAYCGEEITTPNPESQILNLISSAIPNIPPLATQAPSAQPDWEVVWGPAVYTTPGAKYQDNLMFVAQKLSDPTQFVIAVRGTNFVADLDWLMDDFDVLQMMPWPPGSSGSDPNGPQISESTSIDLQVLFSMNGATSNNGSAATSLMSFLLSQTSAAIELCVTGHSLGGTLASTLALFLMDNTPQWDTSGKSIVSCITFAAPTAGNAAFAFYSDSKMSAATRPSNWDFTLNTNCDAVRNNFDVAPMAWIASDLSANPKSSPLFSIYAAPVVPAPNIDFSNLSFLWSEVWKHGVLPDVLPDIANMLRSQNYTQIVASAAPVTGTFNNAIVPSTDATIITYLQAFAAQAAYQHSMGYPILLGVTELNDANIIVRGATPETTTEIRMVPRLARPILKIEQFAVSNMD